MFSGSYAPDDVTFLLKPIELEPTELVQKERLIQAGQRHYSEMISREALPSPAYLRIFHESAAREKGRFARDVLTLAWHIADVRTGPVTVVSLARAGTPVGVLLRRVLRRQLGRSCRHYSISIIRDRGIDERALGFLLEHHPADSIVFVDGWTGKGVIARELTLALASFDARYGIRLDAGLYAVADLCGAAAYAASAEDYLIPSSVLGATISGLVSRSILNAEVTGATDFHGCLYYEEFAPHDLSRSFVDDVYAEIERQAYSAPHTGVTPQQRLELQQTSAAFLADMQRRFGVQNIHHIKPGLGEATRVLLRRVPDCVLVRDTGLAEVAHLLLLAQERNVRVIVDPALPYNAAAFIKELDG